MAQYPHIEKLIAVSEKLGDLYESNGQAGPFEPALSELWEVSRSYEGCLSTMNRFEVSREDFDRFFHQLVEFGAARWAGGHFVAASALAFPLSISVTTQDCRHNRVQRAVSRLTHRFEGRDTMKKLADA